MQLTISDTLAGSARTVCIITATPAADEPRLIRQAETLHRLGFHVIVAGYEGARPPPDFWQVILLEPNSRVLRLRDHVRLALLKAISSHSGAAAEAYYWGYAHFEGAYRVIAERLQQPVDFVIAHDWYTAPIAARIARGAGCPFSVDCHEFAAEQYMHDPVWVRRERPWVRSLERRLLPKADVVTTVCDGIADAYARSYPRMSRPTVVRSTPGFQRIDPSPPSQRVKVLYHGILAPTRGLEEAIASVPMWPDTYDLIIRGPGPDLSRCVDRPSL